MVLRLNNLLTSGNGEYGKLLKFVGNQKTSTLLEMMFFLITPSFTTVSIDYWRLF